MDLWLRFLIGGFVVSAFSLLGDMFKPKSFAGLFAAAPTVALASVVLDAHKHGASYVAVSTRSMMGGAVAFILYACLCSLLLMRRPWKALAAAAALLPVWCATAAALWAVWLRR